MDIKKNNNKLKYLFIVSYGIAKCIKGNNKGEILCAVI